MYFSNVRRMLQLPCARPVALDMAHGMLPKQKINESNYPAISEPLPANTSDKEDECCSPFDVLYFKLVTE